MREILPPQTPFGEYLRELRIARGWSQRELAQQANVDYTYIYKIERGTMAPPGEHVMQALALALGIPLEELLRHSHRIPLRLKAIARSHPLLAELLYELGQRTLPDEQYRKLLTVVKGVR